MRLWQCVLPAMLLTAAARLVDGSPPWLPLAIEYFSHKGVSQTAYIYCHNDSASTVQLVRAFNRVNMVLSTWRLSTRPDVQLWRLLQQWTAPVGVLVDGCLDNNLFEEASVATLFDDTHKWLVVLDEMEATGNSTDVIDARFQNLNLSVDADICVAASSDGFYYELYDVFNFGKIQGNDLEVNSLGSWNSTYGLDIYLKGYKYDVRRNFHNLTFRAVTVILHGYKSFPEEELAAAQFTHGVPFLTKISVMVLVLLKEPFNFTYNYTFIYRWIDSPSNNGTPAVSSELYWRRADLAATCIRIFPAWLQWFDACLPPLHSFQTRIFYRIPERSLGEYENRFLTPLSTGVWCGAVVAGAACAAVLAVAAWRERRSRPTTYAFFSIAAAAFQQDFNDGEGLEYNRSQGGRLALLVAGITSMLLYNYYTSSVVSWLLSAAAPTVDSLEALIQSNLELVLEDTGVNRQWIYNPGPFYFSGFKNIKEDELREKKIKHAKRTVEPMQNTADGINLLRQGGYAFHADVYSASPLIARTFTARELCDLGALPMISGRIYTTLQKRSPYKQFFSWSLSRLSESGLVAAARARLAGGAGGTGGVGCTGAAPRPLALPHAAPALLLLGLAGVTSLIMLLGEILHHRYQKSKSQVKTNKTSAVRHYKVVY